MSSDLIRKDVESIIEISFFGCARRRILIQIVWEFTVREDQVAEFEKFYSSTGSWAALFRRSPGFVGTTLLRDTQTPHR